MPQPYSYPTDGGVVRGDPLEMTRDRKKNARRARGTPGVFDNKKQRSSGLLVTELPNRIAAIRECADLYESRPSEDSVNLV
ncbi:hypothetical protein B7486_04310 [cyanobacterium TDX16]|nr:hypothetical protein B7486_04310 [cyanobacterium TDX16]